MVGSRASVEWQGKVFEGILLPSEGKFIILKLENGYNISLPKDEAKILEEEPLKVEKNEELLQEEGEVDILGFGGTISSKVDYDTGAVSPTIDARELRAQFPEIDSIARVAVKQKLSIFSEEMAQDHWELMAEEAHASLKEGKSVVILHGTDTLSFSSAALSFALSPSKPVVFVGAQRSSDRPSSDNKQNLLDAIYASKQDFGEVAVCMHSSSSDGLSHLHRGTKVRKMHSSRRDAFKSINSPPLAELSWKGYLRWLMEPSPPKELELRNGFSRDVALVYAYPGMDERAFRPLSEYKGVVIAGTGLGHVSVDNVGNLLKDLISSGVYVYMTTQTLGGAVNLNVYSTGRKLKEMGVEGNFNDMLPETAYVKLCWVLARESRRERISELMNSNLAGELSERLVE